VDGDGKLQGRLLKNSEHHKAHAVSATTADQLTERISQLTMSDPTRISRMTDSDSNSASNLESHPSSLYGGPSPFPFGLRDTAASYQALLQDPSSLYDGPGPYPFGLRNTVASYEALLQHSASLVRRVPLIGAQEGLVLTITSSTGRVLFLKTATPG
jgi:hypothetical protein